MRLLLCWSHISGYITACWRALASMPGVELKIIAFESGGEAFSTELVRGLDCRLLSLKEQEDVDLVASLVRERRPELFYVTGWFIKPYRALATNPEFASAKKWMGVDTPWWGTPRQWAARVALRQHAGRFDRVFVAGERAWQYVRRLGVPEAKIRRGMYGVEYDALVPLHGQRMQQEGGWPRRFLYVGRYAQEKGIDTLLEAYARYRQSVSDPWPLGCCGGGVLEPMLKGREGVENFGFRQPAELHDVMRKHGAFVLASHFDPWPLVVVEAAAAGLPIICTEACGSSVEMVRPYYNGIPVATADAQSLADALRWMHDHPGDLPEMGRRGTETAAAYSAQAWARRWYEAARQCLG
jgi:glycosyltransferase involved in cell wall biosynthesis